MQQQTLTLPLLLDFILNRFLVVFIVCLFGSFTRDIYSTIKDLTPISIKRIIFSSIFGSVVLSALLEYVQLEIAISVLVCFCTGMWSFKLVDFVMNWEYMKVLLKHILSNTKTVVGKSLSETMQELNEDSEKKPSALDDKNTNDNIDKNKSEDSS